MYAVFSYSKKIYINYISDDDDEFLYSDYDDDFPMLGSITYKRKLGEHLINFLSFDIEGKFKELDNRIENFYKDKDIAVILDWLKETFNEFPLSLIIHDLFGKQLSVDIQNTLQEFQHKIKNFYIDKDVSNVINWLNDTPCEFSPYSIYELDKQQVAKLILFRYIDVKKIKNIKEVNSIALELFPNIDNGFHVTDFEHLIMHGQAKKIKTFDNLQELQKSLLLWCKQIIDIDNEEFAYLKPKRRDYDDTFIRRLALFENYQNKAGIEEQKLNYEIEKYDYQNGIICKKDIRLLKVINLEQELYDCAEDSTKSETIYKNNEDGISAYYVESFRDLIQFEFLFMVYEAIYTRKCIECGRYFLPNNRNEKYCERPHIEFPGKVCKDIPAYRMKIKKDEENKENKEILLDKFKQRVYQCYAKERVDRKSYDDCNKEIDILSQNIKNLSFREVEAYIIELEAKFKNRVNAYRDDKIYGISKLTSQK